MDTRIVKLINKALDGTLLTDTQRCMRISAWMRHRAP